MRSLIGVVALLLVPGLASAQLKCCYQVTAIDTRTGVVSAAEASTGTTLQFQVRDRLLLARIRVNQQVYADLVARQVGLDGRQACCAIVGTPVPPAQATPPPPPLAGSTGFRSAGTGCALIHSSANWVLTM